MAQGPMHGKTALSGPDPNIQKFKDQGKKTSKGARPTGKPTNC